MIVENVATNPINRQKKKGNMLNRFNSAREILSIFTLSLILIFLHVNISFSKRYHVIEFNNLIFPWSVKSVFSV